MSRLSEHHKTLTNGVGKCSVPMWYDGIPAGFCDKDAYGERPPCKEYYNDYTKETYRLDKKYSGYVPALACPAHGGPPAPTGSGENPEGGKDVNGCDV